MKSVRVWFTKDDEAKFISHLDLNRTMLRAIQHAKIPVWHTEGFNPHPFITFALPLSLGFRGVKETMDMKLTEDMDYSQIIDRLNDSLPRSIRVYKITQPKQKPGRISYALFNMKLTSDETDIDSLLKLTEKLFAMDEIMVEKKSKKGIKEVDLKENFCKYTISQKSDYVDIEIILPAGSTNNVNPNLIVKALSDFGNIEIFADITRLDVYNEEVEPFE